MTNEDAHLRAKLIETAARADKQNRTIYSQFLNMAQQSILLGAARECAVPFTLYGGHEACERKMAAFGYDIIKKASDFPDLSRASAKLKAFADMMDGLIEAAGSGDYTVAELYDLVLEHTDYKNFLKAEKENADERIENVDELMFINE